jgi:uncharacterized protein
MRVTADTNLIVSAVLWGGNPRRLLDAARDDVFDLYTSTDLLAELRGVLVREKFAKRLMAVGSTAEAVFDEISALAIKITPESIDPVITRDPDDDMVLACAVASRSDVIVSGDNDLLDLKQYKNIRIVTATELLSELNLR